MLENCRTQKKCPRTNVDQMETIMRKKTFFLCRNHFYIDPSWIYWDLIWELCGHPYVGRSLESAEDIYIYIYIYILHCIILGFLGI